MKQIDYKLKELSILCSKIDERLFLFDYYSPLPTLLDTQAELQLITCINNLYRLFFDCGKGILATLLNGKFSSNQEYFIPYKHIDKKNNIKKFLEEISNLRAYFCHNNNEKLYLQKAIIDFVNDYFQENCEKNIANLTMQDYKILVKNLAKKTDEVLAYICAILNYFIALEAKKKGEVIQFWLEKLMKWYLDKEIYMNVATEIYSYRCYKEKVSSKSKNKYQATMIWLIRNFKSEEQMRDMIKDEISLLIYSDDCPRPADPIKCIKKVLSTHLYEIEVP